jgi:monovalent cation:H+ antiporter, CPA1 family
MFFALTCFVLVTTIMAWGNERWLKLPTAVGVTLMSTIGSVLMLVWHHKVSPLEGIMKWTEEYPFHQVLMHGVLCFLLFAGALHVDVQKLRQEKTMIIVLSTVGVVLATGIAAVLLKGALWVFEIDLPWMWCLLFGVVVSPTDAVIAADALKRANIPTRLKSKILGESLFNDGTAVVLMGTLMTLMFSKQGGQDFEGMGLHAWAQVCVSFAWQLLGGGLVGWFLGRIGVKALSTVNQPTVEMLVTLACAMTTYTLADLLGASAPIAVVCAGLAIGHLGRKSAMSEETQSRVFPFWELLDELLNVSLFVLIGVQLLKTDLAVLQVAWVAIPIGLLARHWSVAAPVLALKPFRVFPHKSITWLTWGGLRGGISLAMALSIPAAEHTPLLLSLTYAVVVFSIVIQGGLVLPWLANQKTEFDEATD